MTRADKFLTVGIFLLALIGLVMTYQHFFRGEGERFATQANITVAGEVLREIPLSPDGGNSTVTISGRLGPVTIEVAGARIRMRAANCPGQICVKEGWIEHPGESIVCLPGEIVIRIDGPATVDAITR